MVYRKECSESVMRVSYERSLHSHLLLHRTYVYIYIQAPSPAKQTHTAIQETECYYHLRLIVY